MADKKPPSDRVGGDTQVDKASASVGEGAPSNSQPPSKVEGEF